MGQTGEMQQECDKISRRYTPALTTLKADAQKARTLEPQVRFAESQRRHAEEKQKSAEEQSQKFFQEAKKKSDLAKRAIEKADSLLNTRNYCQVGLKDYSAEVDRLRQRSRQLIQRARSVMRR